MRPAHRFAATRIEPSRPAASGGALLVALASALPLLVACGGVERSAAPAAVCTERVLAEAPRPRDVVFVLSDTMRRDRMGVHGGGAETPAFDAFAREHVRFADVTTQSPWTKPAMATLFTGLFPSQHRVTTHPSLPGEASAREDAKEVVRTDVLAGEVTTLAEALRERGYRTAGFVSNPWMKKGFGFAQGFDRYDDSFAANDTPGRVVTDAGLSWLERHGRESERPFFLYLHYMDAHAPYPPVTLHDLQERADRLRSDERPLTPIARRVVRNVVRFPDGRRVAGRTVPASLALLKLAYDRGVEQFDDAFGRLLEGLEEYGLDEDAAIIVTSDHGEALFTRGWGDHGHGLFDDELGVPFAARLPDTRGPEVVDCAAGLIDVLPTLCTYLGLECPEEQIFGHSLIRTDGEAEEPERRYVVSEGVKRKPRHRAIRNRHYKLMWEPAGRPASPQRSRAYGLYAVGPEGDEERDLLAPEHRSDEVERILETMKAALPESVPPAKAAAPGSAPLDAETRARLEALGYLD